MNKNNDDEIIRIINFLLKKDKKLSTIVNTGIYCPIFNKPRLNNKDLFRNLSRSIVGQQLANKVANGIWKKLNQKIKNSNQFLKQMNKINISKAKKFGISKAKLEYIKDISLKVESKKFSFTKVAKLNNNDAINKLMELRGVGSWTAEMFLIFELKRKDIFSLKDAGLKRAISYLYNTNNPSEYEINKITSKWFPYKSIVCWYLWHALDNNIINKTNYNENSNRKNTSS